MKALTICNPFAHLIAIGGKPVENRTWYTKYRGRLAIHAGMSRAWLTPGDEDHWADMVYGGIVAVAMLSECIRIDRLLQYAKRDPWWREVAEHEHTVGPWCWLLRSVCRLPKPVMIRGQGGLWDVPRRFWPDLWPDHLRMEFGKSALPGSSQIRETPKSPTAEPARGVAGHE